MLKKIIAVFLVLLLLLAACTGPSADEQEPVTNRMRNVIELIDDWVCFDQDAYLAPRMGVCFARLGVDAEPRMVAKNASIIGRSGHDLFVRQENQVLWFDPTVSEQPLAAVTVRGSDVERVHFCGVWREQVYLNYVYQDFTGEQYTERRGLYIWPYKNEGSLQEIETDSLIGENWLFDGDTVYTWHLKKSMESEVLRLDLAKESVESLGIVPRNSIDSFALVDGTLFCATGEALYAYTDEWTLLTETERGPYWRPGDVFHEGKAYMIDGPATKVWSLADGALAETLDQHILCNEYGILKREGGILRLDGSDGREYRFDLDAVGWDLEVENIAFSPVGFAGVTEEAVMGAKWDGDVLFEYQ